MMQGCKECEKERQINLKATAEPKGVFWFVGGIKGLGKIGPLTQMMMEEEMRLWKLAYEKRHGHPLSRDRLLWSE